MNAPQQVMAVLAVVFAIRSTAPGAYAVLYGALSSVAVLALAASVFIGRVA